MGPIRILAVGTVLAGAAWVVSRAGSGFLQAGAYMLALFIAVVTVGLTMDAMAERVEEWAGLEARRARKWQRRDVAAAGSPPPTCGSCTKPLQQVNTIWLCAVCDQAVVGA